MIDKYLVGIDWDSFGGIPGIYVTSHHLEGKGWRYFSTYKNGESTKATLFKKLKAAGLDEYRGDWDWHHVVEGNHLAPLFTTFQLSVLYQNEWPTVLLHSADEHKILNGLFRSKGTLLGLNTSGGTLKGRERIEYLNTLHKRYQDLYLGDPVLQLVARNVIKNFH